MDGVNKDMMANSCNEDWKEQYLQHIMDGNKEKAKSLLLEVIPEDKIVYKYFRGINRDFKTITKPALWLCNAYYLNDPFDCAFLLNSCENGINSNEDFVKQMVQNAKSRNMQRTVFLTCFSERPDSILMWGHYANNHRGVCVGYSLRELIEQYDCFPVIYDEKIVQYKNSDSILQETLTKYVEWSYEKEWRIICRDESSREKIGKLIDFVKPKIILLGCKSGDLSTLLNYKNDDKKTDEELNEADINLFIEYSKKELKKECYQFELCPDQFSMRRINIL